MDAGNHHLLVWQTLQHIRLFYTCRPSKIVFYQFSAKVRCYLFITSLNPHASPSSDVLASHLSESPRPRVPASLSPRVPKSHVPVPLLVTAKRISYLTWRAASLYWHNIHTICSQKLIVWHVKMNSNSNKSSKKGTFSRFKRFPTP